MTEPSDRYPGFHEFVAARSAALVRTAYLLTGNQHAAEDLVQEALSRVVIRWRAIVAKGDPEPYVRRVLYTVHVSRWRHLRAHPEVRPPESGLDEAEAATARVVLGNALDRLTPKQRAVLVLRYYEDLTERQTAAVLGISVSTVKSHAAQALLRMRTVGGPTIATLREGVPT
jgi:RNA polymerase sigma-70 factor (sigma-E family)